MAKKTKRREKVKEGLNSERQYAVSEAVRMVKERAIAKFDETIEIALNFGVDPRHSEQMVRGAVSLPNGTGKAVCVAVFAKDGKADEAKAAGADIVGADELAETVSKGTIEFDRCVATPDMMSVVGKLGKILGPRGLMPNPKLGTVTNDVAEAVKAVKGGQVAFRVEKAGLVHAGIGKASFSEDALTENALAFIGAINKAKPTGAKGIFMRRVTLSSTMGAGIRVDVADLSSANTDLKD